MRRKLANAADREEKGVVRAPVAAGESANVVHAATVAEAIERCAVDRPESQTYTALNEPQWSWGETLEWHAPAGTRLVFEGSTGEDDASFVDATLGLAASAVKRYKNHLIPYQVYVPTWLNRRVIHFFRKLNVAGDIEGYEGRVALWLQEFSNRPLEKGTQVPELTETAALLTDQPYFNDIFSPTRVDDPR
jgi:hypothetical protein